MKKFFPLLIAMLLLFSFSSTFSQLLVENFDYPAGDTLTNHGWNLTGTSTVNPVTVVSPGLSYTGYDLSGIGNAASLTTSGQDINKQYTDSVTSGSVYASFLVNVTSAQTTGDYFLHLGVNPTNTFDFFARTFVKLAANGNLAFGISKTSINTSNPAVYSDSIYTTGTTYLLVIKYALNSGLTNDTVNLFINPVISIVEPSTSLTAATTQTDAVSLGTVNLRQGGATSAANVIVDGIRVDTTWADAVVPVELISFTASSQNSSIQLNWTTVTEINNRGFEIERSTDSKSFKKIGFVNGKGTTTEVQSYSFVDNNLESVNKYYYRLKQVDYDGSFSYSQVVDINVNSTPSNYSLMQNYPNPFNPSTTLSFSLPKDSKVTVKIFDLLGREVYKLVNDNLSAGNYNYEINFSNFASGIYLYRLEAYGSDGSSFSTTKKMTLTK